MSKDKVIDVKVAGHAIIIAMVTNGEKKLWRGDMSLLPTVSLDVRDRAGRFAVTLTSAESEEDIITFPDKAKAHIALEQIADAMFIADTGDAPKGSSWFAKLLKVILVLMILFVAGLMLMPRLQGAQKLMSPDTTTSSNMTPATPPLPMPAPAPEPTAPATPAGVPVPADEVLGR